MAPSAGLTHAADTYGPGKQRGPTQRHRLEHPELHWGQRCMVGRPWVRGQSWNHNCYTFSTPKPGNLGTHFSLFCSPKTKHLRSGGLSRMLLLAVWRQETKSQHSGHTLTAILPLEKAFIPSSPPHTPPYLPRLCLLSAPSRRGMDFQHLSRPRVPHPNHCRTGLSSYHPCPPITSANPIYHCIPSTSLSTVLVHPLPINSCL